MRPLIDQLMQVFGAMVAYHNRDLPLARALIREITILSGPERREDVRLLMRIIYDGIGDIVASVRTREKIRSDIDLTLAGETFFRHLLSRAHRLAQRPHDEAGIPEKAAHEARAFDRRA